MCRETERRRMKWQIDFDNFFEVFGTFIIDGYVDDIQPIINENGGVSYGPLSEYLVNRYYEQRTDDKKCVIIYDPSEAECKRFNICVPFEPSDNEAEYGRRYPDKLSNHFWQILHQSALEERMIFHNASGATLDMARIHYAVTEQSRMAEADLPDAFKNFWREFNNPQQTVKGYLFVIKMTSRLLRTGSNGMDANELLLFRELLALSQNIEKMPSSKLVILANKMTDLPMWLTDESTNPFIKKLSVGRPSEENKKAFFDSMIDEGVFGDTFNERYSAAIARRPDEDPNTEETVMEKKIKKKFLAYTNDFTMKMLKYYQNYLERGNTIDSPDKLGFSVSTFKAGTLQNPWEDENKVREILRVTDTVKRKIKGQDQALDTVQGILTRAALGLDRVDNPNAPRVVLFLVGPTGTGKTEVCKQLAEAIFGSEDRMVRFDMSEYGQEHADQKLFGAPPGYVGYEEGGKLTNAMKSEPFSLVLFDEIEKAHRSILDKFLQILGDGRLTDGKGETVSFTDAIIAITSNAGVNSSASQNSREANQENDDPNAVDMKAVIRMENDQVPPDEIYEQVKAYLRTNIKNYFCVTLNRPELYGRIEDSLVYYNYIGRDAVRLISDAKIEAISAVAQDDFKMRVKCPEEVRAAIAAHCQSEHVRSMGARGIGKAVNTLYNGSLSRFLTDYILGANGHERSELEGKTIVCSLRGPELLSASDIEWREAV